MIPAPPMSKDAHDRRQAILNMLPATAKEIELALGYSSGGSFTQLNNLLRQGFIERRSSTYHRTSKRLINVIQKG